MHKEKKDINRPTSKPIYTNKYTVFFKTGNPASEFSSTLTLIISDEQTLHVGSKFKGRNVLGFDQRRRMWVGARGVGAMARWGAGAMGRGWRAGGGRVGTHARARGGKVQAIFRLFFISLMQAIA